MILWIPDYVPSEKPTSGKSKFLYRLAIALKKKGVKIVKSGDKKHDISIHAAHIVAKNVNAKKIIRFDGVWHNTKQDYKAKNKQMIKSMKRSDGVVYQTKFCLSLCRKYLGKFSGPNSVILNGDDISFYENAVPAKSDYEINFLTSARWRPHKRLKETIDSFLAADIKGSCLNIAGDLKLSGLDKSKLKKYLSYPQIKYLGVLDDRQIASWLKISNAFIHLSWIDWCPNAVVEAIAAKCPVITNNVGGTQEIVRPSGGFVCEIDEPWDKKPCRLYSPPEIKRDLVIEAMKICSENRLNIYNSHVDIRNIAQQYLEFMEKILA